MFSGREGEQNGVKTKTNVVISEAKNKFLIILYLLADIFKSYNWKTSPKKRKQKPSKASQLIIEEL